MLFSIIFGLSLFSLLSFSFPFDSHSDNCPFPNGTDYSLHYYTCSANEQFEVTSIEITDKNGNSVYPFDPMQKNILYLSMYNNEETIYETKYNVRLFQYSKSWSGNVCGWSEMPTFGLLDSMDGCKIDGNCPLYHGPNTLGLPIDISELPILVNMMPAFTPYQMEFRLYNYNPHIPKNYEIACVVVHMEAV